MLPIGPKTPKKRTSSDPVSPSGGERIDCALSYPYFIGRRVPSGRLPVDLGGEVLKLELFVFPERSVLSSGILGVNNQESGFGNLNLLVVKHCFSFY